MDKDRRTRRIDRTQNCVIALLCVSFTMMLLQTQLFGTSFGKTLPERVMQLFSGEETETQSPDVTAASLSSPVRIVATNEFARFSPDAYSTSNPSFEEAGTFLGEAIGSAHDISPTGESDFMSMLQHSGLYFDFLAPFPAEALAARLSTEPAVPPNLKIRRCLLCIENSGAVVLLFEQDSGSFFRCATAVSGTILKEYLNQQGGSSVEFAAFSEERYQFLSPLTILASESRTYEKLTASNAIGETTLEDFLRRAEFNAHTRDRYTESNGTIVVLEARQTMRIQPDGRILYQGGAAEEGSVYAVAGSDAETACVSALCAAKRLLNALLGTAVDDFYVSRISETENGFDLIFDYMVNGIPVCFSDGAHAAEIAVEGQSITGFSVIARHYSNAEQKSLLLPLSVSAAIAQQYNGRELRVVYIDTGEGTVEAGWISVP